MFFFFLSLISLTLAFRQVLFINSYSATMPTPTKLSPNIFLHFATLPYPIIYMHLLATLPYNIYALISYINTSMSLYSNYYYCCCDETVLIRLIKCANHMFPILNSLNIYLIGKRSMTVTLLEATSLLTPTHRN